LDASPNAYKQSKDAANFVNYCLFKQNKGWEILSTWIKSSLLWKNSVIRWDFVEDTKYVIEEYEVIDETKLDELLADDKYEIIGDLNLDESASTIQYSNVRLRKKVDNSRVKLEVIPPESFRISNEAKDIEDASYVGLQSEMTRSDLRKYYPEWAKELTENEWNEIGVDSNWLGNTPYSEEISARKNAVGQTYWQGYDSQGLYPLEANKLVTITESWIRVDRDGDGVAELKHFITTGDKVLYEADADAIPLCSIVPFDIPHEFFGLSVADFTRSSTLASTAILRGFVENTYLTNYSPKLADPNVVDFSALQNMKPKQIIPTNGNPTGAVQALMPETISTGTVPLLQHLQTIKEQATGMSKAAQGLNDTLYVSGNSEQKLAAVQTAAQKRIQHIARRFGETGFKRLIAGIYETLYKNMKGKQSYNMNGVFGDVDFGLLPSKMEVDIHIDIGENSNATLINKLDKLGSQILPALNQSGSGMIVKPEAPAVLATKLIEAMSLDSNDFLEDYTTDEFKEKAAKAIQEQTQKAMQKTENEMKRAQADTALAEANVQYTNAQAKNTIDDNARQLAVSIDRHFQEWADLTVKATKEGAELPPHPDYDKVIMLAKQILQDI